VDGVDLIYMPESKIEADQVTKEKYRNLLEKIGEQEDVVEVFDNLF
jgi:transcriptional/translational regulatory protein YebC/TACO1